jgi:hypothetical protein
MMFNFAARRRSRRAFGSGQTQYEQDDRDDGCEDERETLYICPEYSSREPECADCPHREPHRRSGHCDDQCCAECVECEQ